MSHSNDTDSVAANMNAAEGGPRPEEVSIVLTVEQAGALVGAIDSVDRLAAAMETAARRGASVTLEAIPARAAQMDRWSTHLRAARSTIERAIRHGGGGRPL